MNQNYPDNQYQIDDEIDLIKILKILWHSKKLIIAVTAMVTLVAGLYAYNKKPIYQATATATVKIGYYNYNSNSNSNSNRINFESAKDLAHITSIVFRDSSNTSITVKKGFTNFVEVTSKAATDDMANGNVERVVQFIKNKDKEDIDSIKSNIRSSIKIYQGQIDNSSIDIAKASLIGSKSTLLSLLEDHNYTVSELIGGIRASDSTDKSKTKLILAVAAISSFLFSIFLVFVINAFKKHTERSD